MKLIAVLNPRTHAAAIEKILRHTGLWRDPQPAPRRPLHGNRRAQANPCNPPAFLPLPQSKIQNGLTPTSSPARTTTASRFRSTTDLGDS
jgi:hypothetical protein